jgi:hypothetical protein
MKISASSSLIDVAFIVCTALEQVGIQAVLVGGSATTLNRRHAYASRDLDFVISFAQQGARSVRVEVLSRYTREGQI